MATLHSAPNRPFAPIALILAVAVLAIAGSAVITRLTEAHGVVVALYRLWIAAIVALPAALPLLRTHRLRAKHGWLIALSGMLLALHFATWLMSLAYVSVAVSVTLVNTAPIWVAALTWVLFKRAPNRGTIIGISVSVVGGFVIASAGSAGGSNPALGALLALAGAVTVAGYLLISEHVQRAGYPSLAYVGLTNTAAAIAITPAPLIFGEPYGGYPLATYGWFALLALGPQLIGHSGLNYATKFVSPTLVSTVTLLEPLGASILAFFVFREVPPATTLLGSAVLLVGLIITARNLGPAK